MSKIMGYFYGDIVGLEGASGLRSDLPGRRRRRSVQQRRRSLRRHQPLLRQQPGRIVTAPPTSLPRLWPVRVPKLATAILRPVRAPCRARRLLSQAAGRG